MTNTPNAFDYLMKTRSSTTSTSNTDSEDIDNPDDRSIINHGQEEGTPHYFQQNLLYNFLYKLVRIHLSVLLVIKSYKLRNPLLQH